MWWCQARDDGPGAAVAARAEAAPAVAAAEPAAAPKQARSGRGARRRRRSARVEGITEYRLDNGLQVLLFPDRRSRRSTVNITYLVGSRLEGYGETGMAHLLEHMMFKGSPRHRNVLKLSTRRAASATARPGLDRTNYFETLPASQENLEWALDLEADRMVNASISPDDLKTEFSVVRNEFEMRREQPAAHPRASASISTAYLWHNYGKATIGSRSDIERVPVRALRAFYEKYYQPDNAVLSSPASSTTRPRSPRSRRRSARSPQPARELAADLHRRARPGRRAHASTLRRNGDVHVVGLAYHTRRRQPRPTTPRVEAAIDILTREPSGPPLQEARRDQARRERSYG